jgi:hypothetical protein
MKPNSKKQTANLRLSALILEADMSARLLTQRRKGAKAQGNRVCLQMDMATLFSKTCHQRRLAEISGSKSVSRFKATFPQTWFSKKGST